MKKRYIFYIRVVIQLMCFLIISALFNGWIVDHYFASLINATSLFAVFSRMIWFEISTVIWVTLFIIGLSLVLGRVYCSYYCPVGFIQDIENLIISKIKKRYQITSNSYFFNQYAGYVRFAIFCAVISLIAIKSNGYQYFDHYSLWGKLFDFAFSGLVFFMILIISVLVVPRWFCNTICPSGTFFSYFHRNSFLRINGQQEGECGNCMICRQKCPAACMSGGGKIDTFNCIQCFECLEFCPRSKFSLKWSFDFGFKNIRSLSRRDFIQGVGGLAVGIISSKLAVTVAKAKQILPERKMQIMPPGAGGQEQFYSRCVACGICVRACPSKVITTAICNSKEISLSSYFYPQTVALMDYSQSFCDYECNICMGVCPNGALAYYPVEVKKLMRLGVVKLREDLCIAYTKKQDCGACAEHCPTGAVKTRAYGKNGELLAPYTTDSKCIGCGACEYICPVRPDKAIVVTPVAVQTLASEPGGSERPSWKPNNGKQSEDFPF